MTDVLAPLLLDCDEAAAVVGLPASTVAALARSGGIPTVKIGRRVWYPAAALPDWIASITRHAGRQLLATIEGAA